MTFGVIGGDRRQAEVASLLMAEGERVVTYGLGRWRPESEVPLREAAGADAVILPLPLCREDGILNCEGEALPLCDLFGYMRPEQLVLAGQVGQAQLQMAAERGIVLQDYFLQEELTVANAAITAEAALQVAMEQLDCALLGMPCLVLGFGRIGKILSHRLRGIGAEVTATARRREDMAWIRAYGFQCLETEKLKGHLGRYRLVFNTVPAPVLTGELLAELPEGCLCIDLASVSGVDREAAAERGVRLVWARALPGRYRPAAAAQVILDTVRYMILEERSDPA